MSEIKMRYHIHCRSCGAIYDSDVPAVIGQPCPYLFCPRGNPPIAKVWWEHKIVQGTVITGGLAAAGIVLFNIGGWGTFVADLALSFFFQAVVALIVFGVLLTVLLTALKDAIRPLLSNRQVLVSVFLIAVVCALPVVSLVFQRPIDIYDVGSTLVLSIIANLLTRPFERFLYGR